MKSGVGIIEVLDFDKSIFKTVENLFSTAYFQDLNGHRLDMVKKTDGSAALVSRDTQKLHPILQGNSINDAERHGIINIHTQMFFYCWQIINALLNEKNQRLNREIFSAVYEVLYEDINKDIKEHVDNNRNINIQQLNAYIHSQHELYHQWARTGLATKIAENEAELKDKSSLSADIMKISLKENPAINNFHQIESNESLGLITHTYGTPKSDNHNRTPIVKVEQESKLATKPLQTHVHRPLLKPLDGEPIKAQLSTLAASTPTTTEENFQTTYLFTPLSNKKQIKNTLRDVHENNAGSNSKKINVLPIPAKGDAGKLNIYSSDPIIRETKLLTDIAILRSIQPQIKVNLSGLNQVYSEFLNQKSRDKRFFCDYKNVTNLVKQAKTELNASLKAVNLQALTTEKQKLIVALSTLYSKHFIEDSNHKVSKEQSQYAPIIHAIHMALNNNQGYERVDAEQYGVLKSLADLFLAYAEGTIQDSAIKNEIESAITTFLTNGQDNVFATNIQNINRKYNAYGSATHASLNSAGVPDKKFISQMRKMATTIETLKAVKPLADTSSDAKEVITTTMEKYQTGRSWLFFSWRHHKTEVGKMLDELSSIPEGPNKNTVALTIFSKYEHEIRNKKNYNDSGALQKTFASLKNVGMFAHSPAREVHLKPTYATPQNSN